jgi:hypothetical protein
MDDCMTGAPVIGDERLETDLPELTSGEGSES